MYIGLAGMEVSMIDDRQAALRLLLRRGITRVDGRAEDEAIARKNSGRLTRGNISQQRDATQSEADVEQLRAKRREKLKKRA